MEKADIMSIGTILKFLIGLIGMIVTLVMLIIGLMKRDNKRLKKAGMIFLGTWMVLVVLGAIEFLFLTD